MTRLTDFPNTDTPDVRFRSGTDEQSIEQNTVEPLDDPENLADAADSKKEPHEGEPSGCTRAHYERERLVGLPIEHVSRRAPASWDTESLRREAAQVAASAGRLVESVTRDRLRDRTSFQTGELGPQSLHTSDATVPAFNQMVDEALETSAAA